MAVLEKYTKQPAERLDYDIDFASLFLSALGDTAPGPAGLEVTCEPVGLTVDDSLLTAGKVKVWLSGGTSGTTYKVTARVTTTAGRVKEAEIAVKVKEA